MVRNELVHFVECAKGFDNNAKLKLVLFAAGLKRATFVSLKVRGDNLDEKYHFEQHLRREKVLFRVSGPKSFEEVAQIKNNKVLWRLTGIWFGYDLFVDKRTEDEFDKYVDLSKGSHKKADLMAGRIYGYPVCCVNNFVKEHDLKYLKKKYSYYAYYSRLHELDRAFPFLCHTACSVVCSESNKLNKKYMETVKRLAPRFYREYSSKQVFESEFICSSESMIYENPLLETKPLWRVQDGRDYSFLSRMPVKGSFYLFSHLVKDKIQRGAVFSGKVVLQYDYADVFLGKKKFVLSGFHHERKLPLLKV